MTELSKMVQPSTLLQTVMKTCYIPRGLQLAASPLAARRLAITNRTLIPPLSPGKITTAQSISCEVHVNCLLLF